MPNTLAGLSISVAILIPGYVHFAIRRNLAPAKHLSRAMESMSLVVVAVVANMLTLAFLTAILQLPPIHGRAPDLAQLLRDPGGYILLNNTRLLYVLGWTTLFVLLASGLSVAFAYRVGPLNYLSRRLAPALGQYTAWHHVVETNVPGGSDHTHLICELVYGGYAAGDLAWYSAESQATPDRDLVLAPPLQVWGPDRPDSEVLQEGRLVLSARDIRRIYGSYVSDQR